MVFDLFVQTAEQSLVPRAPTNLFFIHPISLPAQATGEPGLPPLPGAAGHEPAKN